MLARLVHNHNTQRAYCSPCNGQVNQILWLQDYFIPRLDGRTKFIQCMGALTVVE